MTDVDPEVLAQDDGLRLQAGPGRDLVFKGVASFERQGMTLLEPPLSAD